MVKGYFKLLLILAEKRVLVGHAPALRDSPAETVDSGHKHRQINGCSTAVLVSALQVLVGALQKHMASVEM